MSEKGMAWLRIDKTTWIRNTATGVLVRYVSTKGAAMAFVAGEFYHQASGEFLKRAIEYPQERYFIGDSDE